MLASANCSKGCRVEAVEGGWVYWNGQRVSAGYKSYLEESQAKFKKKVADVISRYR